MENFGRKGGVRLKGVKYYFSVSVGHLRFKSVYPPQRKSSYIYLFHMIFSKTLVAEVYTEIHMLQRKAFACVMHVVLVSLLLTLNIFHNLFNIFPTTEYAFVCRDDSLFHIL